MAFRPENFVRGWNLMRVIRNLPEAMGKARNLGRHVREFQYMLSLLQDYAAGRYTNVSASTVALMTLTAAYVICPMDAMPDLLPMVGFGDDIALLGATLVKVKGELAPYLEWRKAKKAEEENSSEKNDENK
ncbi:MAG: DUF1232 domain-containing protein [Planctomycetaceae bacterium]|nr:DUF1232 domain-containing protein [Planctomycetaceae bacterium]